MKCGVIIIITVLKLIQKNRISFQVLVIFLILNGNIRVKNIYIFHLNKIKYYTFIILYCKYIKYINYIMH